MAETSEVLDSEVDFGLVTPPLDDTDTVFEECEKGNVEFVLDFLHGSDHNISLLHKMTRDTLLHVCARNGHDDIATKILQFSKVDFEYLNTSNLSGDSCLHVAAQFGNHEILAKILAHNSCVDLMNKPNDFTSDSPLDLAFKFGHLKCIDVLLQNHKIGQHFRTAGAELRRAIEKKDFAVTNYLLKYGASVNETSSPENLNGLHAAAKSNCKEMLELILPLCDDLEVAGTYGTALQIASRNWNMASVELLLDAGADYHMENPGPTLLHICARNGWDNIARKILRYPNMNFNYLNQRNGMGDTCLHVAAQFGQHNVLSTILAHELSMDLVNEQSVYKAGTPLDRAFKYRSLSCIDVLLQITKVKECFQTAEVELRCAIARKDFEITKYLLQYGACVNERNEEDLNSLHAAVKSNCKEMVELILPLCADVNFVSKQGTALHMAAENGNKAILELLINAGADLEIESSVFNETALHKAAKVQSHQCFSLLTKSGADNMKRTIHEKTALEILYTFDPTAVIDMLSNSHFLFRFHSFRRAAIALIHKESIHPNAFRFDGVASPENFSSFIHKHKEDFVLLLHALVRSKCSTASANVIRFFKSHNFDSRLFTITSQSEGLLNEAIKYSNREFIVFLLTFPTFMSYCSFEGAQTEGQKALHTAVFRNQVDLVDVLLDAGVRTSRTIPEFYYADHKYNQVTRYMIEAGEYPVEQTVKPHKIPAIQYALICQNYPMVSALLKKGASLNVKDKFGFTPLHDAVWSRKRSMVNMMFTPQTVNAQISIPLPDVFKLDGSTPLHIASRAIYPEMVRLLLQKGARVKIYDNHGRLPLDLSFMQKDYRSIVTLISAGADVLDLTEPLLRRKPYIDELFAMPILKLCGFFNRYGALKAAFHDDPNYADYIRPEPMTLEEICGAAIRKALTPNAWLAIDQLPLPQILKESVTFHLKGDDGADDEDSDSEYDYPIWGRLECHNIDHQYPDDSDSDAERVDDPIMELLYDP